MILVDPHGLRQRRLCLHEHALGTRGISDEVSRELREEQFPLVLHRIHITRIQRECAFHRRQSAVDSHGHLRRITRERPRTRQREPRSHRRRFHALFVYLLSAREKRVSLRERQRCRSISMRAHQRVGVLPPLLGPLHEHPRFAVRRALPLIPQTHLIAELCAQELAHLDGHASSQSRDVRRIEIEALLREIDFRHCIDEANGDLHTLARRLDGTAHHGADLERARNAVERNRRAAEWTHTVSRDDVECRHLRQLLDQRLRESVREISQVSIPALVDEIQHTHSVRSRVARECGPRRPQ